MKSTKNLNTIIGQDQEFKRLDEELILSCSDEFQQEPYQQIPLKTNVIQTQVGAMTYRELNLQLEEEMIIKNKSFCVPALKFVFEEMPKSSQASFCFSNQFIGKQKSKEYAVPDIQMEQKK
ncbi:unnamed protein product (macronuclear) [Paramecium tetraurelia]|uniref:Uncharacterized protein n=1 Tax=Paramecium tetraurelia TaxID=5888 RepID=A0D3L6_PARTE|nr:uncharacterized protein GSPATT00013121001 [Paramecium tetraurelia]CAK77633.1 unnamed protein product [Paramecium tetraurelia]|eukprot:XP_001445030.1 hypothetical protein (macronuclear) [Paramecium tetraurelia strain d4-2]